MYVIQVERIQKMIIKTESEIFLCRLKGIFTCLKVNIKKAERQNFREAFMRVQLLIIEETKRPEHLLSG